MDHTVVHFEILGLRVTIQTPGFDPEGNLVQLSQSSGASELWIRP